MDKDVLSLTVLIHFNFSSLYMLTHAHFYANFMISRLRFLMDLKLTSNINICTDLKIQMWILECLNGFPKIFLLNLYGIP